MKVFSHREKHISRLLLRIQLARIDERARLHAQGQPAFPNERWWDLRQTLDTMRKRVVKALEDNETLPTPPPNLWDKIICWLADWALEPKLKKVDQATLPYEG